MATAVKNVKKVLVSRALSPQFERNKIRQVLLDLDPSGEDEKLAFILENVFSGDECKKLIEISERQGYVPSVVHSPDGTSHLPPGFRDSHSVLIIDNEFSKILFKRISSFLPKKFQAEKLVEINDRLCFLKYIEGDAFKIHTDNQYIRPDKTAASLITIQIYLNRDFEGGETTLLRLQHDGSYVQIPVIPKTGMILVFEHEIEHEGCIIKSGLKYTVRTDILYTLRKKVYVYEGSNPVLDTLVPKHLQKCQLL